MRVFTQVNDEGRITGMTADESLVDGFWYEFPDDFDLNTMYDHVIVGGVLAYDPSPDTIAEQEARAEAAATPSNMELADAVTEVAGMTAEQDERIAAQGARLAEYEAAIVELAALIGGE